MIRSILLSTLALSHSALMAGVNAPATYPVSQHTKPLTLSIDAGTSVGRIDKRIFGTNLEWFNDAGGLVDLGAQDLSEPLLELARDQGTTVYRFPGGILADYYNWRDGIGDYPSRPTRPHLTDSGQSKHYFGSPEFFSLLNYTGGEGMITVNAGTGTAAEAAAWVEYANAPTNHERTADGHPAPIGIKLWEVGNELYLPGNPHEPNIAVEPEVYAARFGEFSKAMRATDSSIELLAIAEAVSNNGSVRGNHPDWTEVLLQNQADNIDYIAVHNAYFPTLHFVTNPSVEEVYPRLWASPEAIDRSLDELSALIDTYENSREIGIAITEWGTLFSSPVIDTEWFDHSKTLGAGVYIGRTLQVFMTHPRVKIANHFKFVDRSFLGVVNYEKQPKVPYWVLKLYAQHSGDTLLSTQLNSPTYDTTEFSVMQAENDVAEVTAVASLDSTTGHMYVNLVNRSINTQHQVQLKLNDYKAKSQGKYYIITADEPTAHNGRDWPPEQTYTPDIEPYSTAKENSIKINEQDWNSNTAITIPPFSIVTVELIPAKNTENKTTSQPKIKTENGGGGINTTLTVLALLGLFLKRP